MKIGHAIVKFSALNRFSRRCRFCGRNYLYIECLIIQNNHKTQSKLLCVVSIERRVVDMRVYVYALCCVSKCEWPRANVLNFVVVFTVFFPFPQIHQPFYNSFSSFLFLFVEQLNFFHSTNSIFTWNLRITRRNLFFTWLRKINEFQFSQFRNTGANCFVHIISCFFHSFACSLV